MTPILMVSLEAIFFECNRIRSSAFSFAAKVANGVVAVTNVVAPTWYKNLLLDL